MSKKRPQHGGTLRPPFIGCRGRGPGSRPYCARLPRCHSFQIAVMAAPCPLSRTFENTRIGNLFELRGNVECSTLARKASPKKTERLFLPELCQKVPIYFQTPSFIKRDT